MSEISQKQFWLDEIKIIEDDVELLSGLISLPKLDEKIISEAANEIIGIYRKIKD
jgi:hypothetical protein